MNWDQIEGSWKQFQGKIQARWGELTDDDLEIIKGNRKMLVGKIQEKYGIQKEQAEREVEDYIARM
jgi:uncharacterized protein YjbJ (UPF0337 family)